jgi:hypothetical protein
MAGLVSNRGHFAAQAGNQTVYGPAAKRPRHDRRTQQSPRRPGAVPVAG